MLMTGGFMIKTCEKCDIAWVPKEGSNWCPRCKAVTVAEDLFIILAELVAENKSLMRLHEMDSLAKQVLDIGLDPWEMHEYKEYLNSFKV